MGAKLSTTEYPEAGASFLNFTEMISVYSVVKKPRQKCRGRVNELERANLEGGEES